MLICKFRAFKNLNFAQVKKCKLTLSFKIFSAFEWNVIVFAACLQQLQARDYRIPNLGHATLCNFHIHQEEYIYMGLIVFLTDILSALLMPEMESRSEP